MQLVQSVKFNFLITEIDMSGSSNSTNYIMIKEYRVYLEYENLSLRYKLINTITKIINELSIRVQCYRFLTLVLRLHLENNLS